MQTEPPKTEPPKRERRWFQFSLRTLMILVTLLAVACGYVAWQANIVRDRKAVLREIVANGGTWYPLPFTPEGLALSHRSPVRWLLDDWYCTLMIIPPSMEARVDEIRPLFSSTDIYFVADFPNRTMEDFDPKTWPPPRYRAGK
jgi:hypothetical protein